MKKLLLLIICLAAIICVPLNIYAEDTVVENEVVTTIPDTTTVPEEDVVPPEEDTTIEEAPIEDGTTDVVPENPTDEGGFSWEEVKDTLSSTIMVWVQEHIEEIGVVCALIGYGITLFGKFKTVNKSIGTMNNNTVTFAKEAMTYMDGASNLVKEAADTVASYKEKMDKLLEAYDSSEEARKKLEIELLETKEYLKVSSKANLEFSNELSELLALANIPNYKKEEIGQRHLSNVAAILEAEAHAEKVAEGLVSVEGVKTDVGEEA